MKDCRILEALSEIDDRYILEAEPIAAQKPEKKKTVIIFRILAIAAAAVLLTGGTLYAGFTMIRMGSVICFSSRAFSTAGCCMITSAITSIALSRLDSYVMFTSRNCEAVRFPS